MKGEPDLDIAVRPATTDDLGFLLDLFFAQHHDELALTGLAEPQLEALLRMQFDAQRASYGAQYRIAQDHIITANELSVGRIWIDAGGHQPTHDTTIVDISVHPRVQGHGIGTKVLRSVLNSAQTRGSLVVLHVAVGNRARELYRRLGFVDGGGEGMHERMTWRAPAKADTTDGSEERRASGLVGVR